jgi:Acyl-CoA thioesterase N-terminal domain
MFTRDCEPMGRANAHPMTGSAKQSISTRKVWMDCFVATLLAMTETVEMLAKTQHLFDDATRVTAGDSRWRGQTSDDYWAFVGPFGGATAAAILRALIDHPQRAGDPLALTVNFCAPIAQGAFDLDVRQVKANRSTQHWSVELSQDGAGVATFATAVFAERRPSWSHQQAKFPQARPFEQTLSYPEVAASWVKQYDLRFVESDPDFSGAAQAAPANAFSKL